MSMTRPPRLPPLPALDWKPDGTPVARAMDDVYFSVKDGLAEARAVFLAGCGLPERWAGRERFTVAELGFGTGLNLLALWKLWRAHRPGPDARLDFVSFEGFPLRREDAARALERWPELGELARVLVQRWPVRARGLQRVELGDGVCLTLHIDEVGAALANSVFEADAWFLDGFAPAKNAGMWAPELYPLMLERSRPGAWVGTYTVAGAVRRGLAEAGFDVSKQPGFARKRERLQAIAPERAVAADDPYGLVQGGTPRKVAIIGAGIAGAAVARAFLTRGADVTVFDGAEQVASGASGNRLALVMPRLDASDTGPARVLLASYLRALDAYEGLAGVTPVEVGQRPANAADEERFAKLLADPPLPYDRLRALPDGGLLHEGALILEPAKLVPALLAGARLELGKMPDVDLASRTVDGAPYDAIILANGMALKGFAQTEWLPLEARLGQVEVGAGADGPASAVASGHYALSLGTTRLWGATFEPADGPSPVVSEAARRANADALGSLVEPGWAGAGEPVSRAGFRATTQDRLPLAGPVPDYASAVERFAGVRHGRPPAGAAPLHAGLWMLGGLGARGFTFAPAGAELIASSAYGEPLPMGRAEAELVSPMRFIFRGLKRGQV